MVETPGTLPLFKFDAVKFAKDILAEIERFRGYDPLSGDDKSGGGTHAPAESRVNAFFRLLGLPMILSVEPKDPKSKNATGQKSGPQVLRTPGYAMGRQIMKSTIRDSEKVDVKDPKGTVSKTTPTTTRTLRNVLSQREKALLRLESSIGDNSTNDAMTQAFHRPVGMFMDIPSETVITEIETQTTDGANTTTKVEKKTRTVFKRLSPFLTAYRDIFPAERNLARPFLADRRQGFFINQELKRPFIETVLYIRLVSTKGAGTKKSMDYLTTLRTELRKLEKAARNNKKELREILSILPKEGELLEAFVIEHMLGAVYQLAKTWVLLQRRREDTLKKIEVSLVPKTASARQSSLGKRSNDGVKLTIKRSELGSRMSKLQACVAASEAIIGLIPTQDSAHAKGLTGQLASPRNISANALTTPFISVLRQDLEQERKQLASLKQKLKDESQKADRLRLELEMMTGEFLGLSIPDIIFTMLALFLIEQSDLLALLDADAIEDLQASPNKTLAAAAAGITPSAGAAVKAADKIRDRVEKLYDLLDAVIKTERDRTKRPTVVKNRGKSTATTNKTC